MNTKPNIKVIWLATWWPRPNHPVLGIFTKRDAEAVAPYCDLVVVHAMPHARNNFIIEDTVNNKGFQEVLVYYPNSNSLFGWFNMIRGYFKAMHWVIQKGFTPNVLHLHIVSIAGLAILYLHLKHKIPLFISEHWSGFSMVVPPIGWFNKWLGKLLVRRSSGVFAVTKAMADKMIQIGWEGDYLVNPNVVDTDFFTIGSNLQTSPFRFIHVSSLDEEHKNIAGLLRATFQVAMQEPNFTITIIGGDEGTAQVEQMAKSLGLEDKLRILGIQSAEVVRNEMQASHAFVLFSNREGLPCVILEAMATGLPVISSNIQGLEEWVTPKTGVLVPIGDEALLTAAMLKMMADYQRYEKNEIRKKIVRECSYPVVGRRIVGAYEEALAKAKKRS